VSRDDYTIGSDGLLFCRRCHNNRGRKGKTCPCRRARGAWADWVSGAAPRLSGGSRASSYLFDACKYKTARAEAVRDMMARDGWPTGGIEQVIAENKQILRELDEFHCSPLVFLVCQGTTARYSALRYLISCYDPVQEADGTWVWDRNFDKEKKTLLGRPIDSSLKNRAVSLRREAVNFNEKLVFLSESGCRYEPIPKPWRVVLGIEPAENECDHRPAEMIPEDYYAL